MDAKTYKKVVKLYEQGLTSAEIARQTGVLPSKIQKIIKEIEEIKSETDEVLQEELPTPDISFDDFVNYAANLKDSAAFLKGLAAKIGFRTLELLETGEVEEIVAGGAKFPAKVLKRKIDFRDLKYATDTLKSIDEVLNKRVEDLANITTLKVEFVEPKKKGS